MIRIDAQRLIPGRGEPISPGAVVIDQAKVAYAGASAGAPDAPTSMTVDTVMPGMWDCHAHFMGIPAADISLLLQTHPAVAAVRAMEDARRALMAGFTSHREVGGYGVFLARAIDEGSVIGPTIYGAGGVLSQTGGHADFHAFPLDQVHELTDRLALSAVCDGVDECRKAVRKQLRVNAKVIKVCASGGVMSEVDHPIHQQFSGEELRVIVEEAARAERVVAAHCHGKPGIMAALEAGVTTIEHGTYLDEESAQLMVEKDAILVPTRWIVEELNAAGPALQMPDWAYEKLTVMVGRHRDALQIAREAGVRVATGTDIFVSGPQGGYGTNGRELGHLVDGGFTPLEAIEAATATGPLTVGPQARRAGELKAGWDADVIAVAGNPLDDIALLADADNITHVWKQGDLVKALA
jgi:imidazolonepropionase-like amidohydrolase